MEQFLSSNGAFKGVLNNIVTNFGEENVRISVSGSYEDRDPYNVLEYDNPDSIWTSQYSADFGQWLQIELLDRYLDLTAYALQSHSNYPTHWDFSVSRNNKDWINVDEIRNNYQLKLNIPGIFECEKKNVGFLRFFRITNRGMNHRENNKDGNDGLYISLIDLYGSVIKCKGSCQMFYMRMTIKEPGFKLQFIVTSYYLVLIKK